MLAPSQFNPSSMQVSRQNTITVVRRGSTKPTAKEAMNSEIKINRININAMTAAELPKIQGEHIITAIPPPVTNPYDEIEIPQNNIELIGKE